MIFIIFTIIVILLLLYFTIYPDSLESNNELIPTIHSKCENKIGCGGDLICDCQRCKSQLHGPCSGNVDCETGLICSNWQCMYIDSINTSTEDTKDLPKEPLEDLPKEPIEEKNPKKVHWEN